MCLPNFQRFEIIRKDNPIVGYRSWYVNIKEPKLKSTNQDFIWKEKVGPVKVTARNSGFYSYNNNNYNNNYNYYNYHVAGIIHQYGKVAIHEIGYRSQYAKIIKLFTIKESDAKSSPEFIQWISKFNELIRSFGIETVHYQDFVESENGKNL